jgi:hypothetical protein
MLGRVLVCLCLAWGAVAPLHADEPVPGVVLKGATVKDDRGRAFKLRRGDKLTVLSIKGDRAHVATQGKTAWVPVKLLLIAQPKDGSTPAADPQPGQDPAPTPQQDPAPSSDPPAPNPGRNNPPVAAATPAPVVAPATLAVNSDPPGAAVSVDGQSMGVTPLAATSVSRGSHRVELTLDGHEPLSQEVPVRGEVVLFLAPRPKAAPATAPAATATPAATPSANPAATPGASPDPAAPPSDTPPLAEENPRRFWPRLVAPFPVLFTGVLATVLVGVGVAAAVLWVASANAILLKSTGFKFKDDLSNTVADNVARREILAAAALGTAVAPLLGLALGALGALTALAIMNL